MRWDLMLVGARGAPVASRLRGPPPLRHFDRRLTAEWGRAVVPQRCRGGTRVVPTRAFRIRKAAWAGSLQEEGEGGQVGAYAQAHEDEGGQERLPSSWSSWQWLCRSTFFSGPFEWPTASTPRPRRFQSGATSIKGDTSVIEQLTHTNDVASSILKNRWRAAPDGSQSLQAKLNTIIATAKSIDNFAVSVNGTANAIQRHGPRHQRHGGSILTPATAINTDATAIKAGWTRQ